MPELLVHALFGALAVTDPGLWGVVAAAAGVLGLMGLVVCLAAEFAETRHEEKGEER
jgi:hypothetical protein